MLFGLVQAELDGNGRGKHNQGLAHPANEPERDYRYAEYRGEHASQLTFRKVCVALLREAQYIRDPPQPEAVPQMVQDR